MGRFVSRFAVGRDGQCLSSVWRVWTAKNQPDLYLAVRDLGGEIKATVHAPRPARPTWERHFGFDKNAKSVVSQRAKRNGGPHKVTWRGFQLATDVTLEFRIVIRGTSLEDVGVPVGENVALLPVPSTNEYVEVDIILGPQGPTNGYPRVQDGEAFLLNEGRMSDSRRIWIVYHVGSMSNETIASSITIKPEGHIDPNADLCSGSFRGITIGTQDDGSVVFGDLKACVHKNASEP